MACVAVSLCLDAWAVCALVAYLPLPSKRILPATSLTGSRFKICADIPEILVLS